MLDAGVDVYTDNEYQREQFNEGKASWVLNGVVKNAAGQFVPNTTAISFYDYIDDYYSSGRLSSNWLSDSFAKLREVSLTYKLPKGFLGKHFIKDGSFSLIGQNLLIISNSILKNYADPEVGSDNLQTPTTRNLGFNINLKF